MSDRGRVLIADDDSEVRDLVSEYLTERGFEVLQAANGLEALLCVKHERPRAAILDISMPRLGGLEALKRIRAHAPLTRVIVYTGNLDADVEREAVALGAAAVFAKSVALDTLRLAIEGEGAIQAPETAMAMAVANAGPPPTSGGARRLRVLLIDDDAEVSELLGEFLRSRGVDMFTVSNAVDALRLLAQGVPDAIFLDIDMPHLTGLEALPAIKALAPDAKVVMLSGVDDDTIARQTLAKGAFDYIVKPPDLSYLGRTLETIKALTAQGL